MPRGHVHMRSAKFWGFLSPLPLVRISRNLSLLFVRKIGQFLNPPPPLRVDVICTWSPTMKMPRFANRGILDFSTVIMPLFVIPKKCLTFFFKIDRICRNSVIMFKFHVLLVTGKNYRSCTPNCPRNSGYALRSLDSLGGTWTAFSPESLGEPWH